MHPFFEDYFERLLDLHRQFAQAITGLTVEALDWVPGKDMNSLCVLVVHVCGAERYWVGDVPLGDDSGRDRSAEFRASGLAESELKRRLSESEVYVHRALARINIDDLSQSRESINHPGRTFTIGWSLLHALEHTGGHLGHAQITRQLWDARP